MKRSWHLVVGGVGVAVFLGTGYYMASHFPALHGGDGAIRYQFRANHGYILLGSLANVLAGFAGGGTAGRWRAGARRLGGLLLLVAPAVFLAAFVIEPPRASPDRPITLLGMVLMLAGTGFQVLGRLPSGKPR